MTVSKFATKNLFVQKLFNAKNYRTKYFGHEIFVIYDSLIWTRSQESTKLNLFVY